MLDKYDVINRTLRDHHGQPLGQVTAFYRYPREFDAPWGLAAVTRRRRIFGKDTYLVDLHNAVVGEGMVTAAYPTELIIKAPQYEPTIGNVLDYDDAAEVLAHYGIRDGQPHGRVAR